MLLDTTNVGLKMIADRSEKDYFRRTAGEMSDLKLEAVKNVKMKQIDEIADDEILL